MGGDLCQKLKNKGYKCEVVCKCKVHQIINLGIKEINIPDLAKNRRIGVVKYCSVSEEKLNKKPVEKVETESTVLEKYWYESVGVLRELVVVLEESRNIEEIDIENNSDKIIRFVRGKDEKINEYRKKVILRGIKSLFESGEISCWNKTIYFLHNINSIGKSSGLALLLSFYSAYFEIGIPNNFSTTGAIDVNNGNIKEIGGLKEKMIKAIRNKETDSLILPQENHQKALEILNKYRKKYSNPNKIIIYPVNNWRDLISLLHQWKNQ